MWVKNCSRFPQALNKGEKIVVLMPQSIADVDLPEDANLGKLGLRLVDLEPSLVVAPIAPIKPMTSNKKGGKKKKGCRDENRK